MKKWLFAGLMVLTVVACSNVTSHPLVCEAIPDGSYSVICELSEKNNTTPEVVAGVLKVGNTAALASNVYTAKQADNFLDEIQALLEVSRSQGSTYAIVREALTKKYIALPPAVKSVFVILTSYSGIFIDIGFKLLSDYDYVLLFRHIEDQRKIIEPFLIVE